MLRIISCGPPIVFNVEPISQHLDMGDKLNRGDRVVCKLKAGKVVNAYAPDWDEKFIFEIVATDNRGYYIYVPHYINVKGGLIVNKQNQKTHSINKKFVGELILFITENSIVKIESKADGLICDKCKEFITQAQSEDPVFICWVCRTYPYR